VIGNPGSASYDDLTAVNGTTYYYVVSAINTAGESANSNQASGAPGPQPSGTTLVSSPVATGPYGTPVTFTATVTVSGGPATGTVTFRNGATVLGASTLDGTGQAGITTSTLAVASHALTATYEGDGTFGSSVSAPLAYAVTPQALTITGVTAGDKVYDGNASAVLTGGAVSGGVVGGESVGVVPGSGTFASANAGTWAVTATGYALGGADAGNYVLSAQPAVPNASITPRPVQLTGTRSYDATALATAADLTVANKVGGDDLVLTGSAPLTGKDVGMRDFQSSFSTPVRVQSATGTTGSTASTTCTVNLTTNPVPGNTLVAVISTRGTSANRISGISGGGVTWSRAAQATNAQGTTTEIWHGPNVASGSTAITITQASLRSAAVVIEYSGILSASALDRIASATGTGTAAVTGTTPLTTQADELWIGGIGIRDGRRTLNAPYGNAFTVVASRRSGSANGDSMIYALEKIVNSTGAAGSGGTLNTSDDWSGAIATFKAAPISSLALTGTAAANYTLTGLTGAVDITPAELTITADNQSKTYGQTLEFGSGATQFTSSGLMDGETIGSVTMTCAGGDAAAGVASYPITPSAATGGSFSAANYAINYLPGSLTVSPAPTTITTPPTATAITYGQTLASSTLSGGAASVPGDFAFTAPSTAPPVGTAQHSVTFTPADADNYQTATTSVSVTVGPARTPFEAWAADPVQGLTAGVNDGPMDDPDRDGVPNLLEFALGGGPMVSFQAILPKLTENGGAWVFSYQRGAASRPPATTQIVEYGDNLSGWTQLTIPLETTTSVTITPQGETDRVEVTLPAPGPTGFTRLKVSQ
jgi:hypothetical protein